MLNGEYVTLNDFKFDSGEILPEITIEFATQGNKQLDSHGNISNAFLYLHGWSGDYTSVENLNGIIGPGKAIDTNKYYVISPTALGAPGSSCPSSTDLGNKFPNYTIKDMIRTHYQLITEKLGIKHLKGIMGTSMGGFQALNWAIEYPEFMDFLILNGTSHRISNRMFGAYHLMNEIIENDAGYDKGNYSENPVKTTEIVAYLSYLFSLAPENYEKCFKSREEFIEGVGERKSDGHNWDANDLLWRNKALLQHDLKDEISQIKVPALVIGIYQDQIVDEKFCVLPLVEGLKNSKLFMYNSIYGHYGCTKDILKAFNAIADFMDSV